MTRPDARLLVPVSALPSGRAPVGATVWQEHPYRGPSAGVTTYCREDAEVYVVWADGRLTYEPASALYLDLSRPDVVDGAEVRLDALGFACSVLAKRHKPVARALLLHDLDLNLWRDVEEANNIALRRDESPVDLDPGVGLPRCMAARAVVAAALRGGA